ncbi:MAG TPA: hypothetical protein VJZ75_02960 [Candidatus Bathyarchaeia archaeon]|nr:hypothetical protein [Candidatus Bathyarchaeia archaeon]
MSTAKGSSSGNTGLLIFTGLTGKVTVEVNVKAKWYNVSSRIGIEPRR